MKREYMSPVAEVLETRLEQMLAGSVGVTGNGDVVVSESEAEEGDPIDACMRGDNFLFNMIFKSLLVMVLSTITLAVRAQTLQPAGPPADGKTHAMTITLKNGTTVSYELKDMSHVTYLPGIGMKVYLKTATTSVDYLFSQMTKIEYVVDSNDNANWETTAGMWTDYPEAWRLEYPQLSDNLSPTKEGAETKSQLLVKRTGDYGITYSVEWDNAKIANRWTCYQLHAGNTLAETGRHDDFKADEEVAVSATLNDYKSSGFSRGHLCPSADRLCSDEQNKQTFYLTNMQPQYQTHNGVLWANLETLVRDYATNDSYTDSHCDTLYIVKAATISDKVTIDGQQVDGVYPDVKCGLAGTCDHELLVPKYFYMALLHYNKATDTYHAVAFWTEHLNVSDKNKNFGDYAISIDELQRRTGIDFFCNLPDAVEVDVEATVDLDFWNLTKKN